MDEMEHRTPEEASAEEVTHPQDSQSHTDREDTVTLNGKKHAKRTVFFIAATIVGLMLFAAAVMEPVVLVARNILRILSPLIIGAVIAYLCDPFLEFFEFRVFRRLKKGELKRGLCLFCTVVVIFTIVAVVGALIIPQLVTSINDLFNNADTHLDRLLKWLQTFINKLTADLPVDIDISDATKLVAFIEDMFGTAENALSQIMTTIQQFADEGNLLEKAWAILLTLFDTFKNLFIGLFIAFYILASKEKRAAQIAKFRRAMFKEKTDNRITEIVTLADNTFGGFIYGKILDSIVIGILTFVLMSIFEISPYNVLIATFVGITNVIPVFGPFIGAIPSFFIVLISNPDKAVLFLILILIIQQLDGNIIGPKILGDNTGVSSLSVIVAISICSALWGVVGMLIGVPIFAVIIELVKRYLEARLEAKGAPTDTLHYYPDNAVVDAEQDLYYEHSSLRYAYEHSRIKPHVDRLRDAILTHLGRQDPAVPTEPTATEVTPPTEETPDPTQTPSDSDGHTDS